MKPPSFFVMQILTVVLPPMVLTFSSAQAPNQSNGGDSIQGPGELVEMGSNGAGEIRMSPFTPSPIQIHTRGSSNTSGYDQQLLHRNIAFNTEGSR